MYPRPLDASPSKRHVTLPFQWPHSFSYAAIHLHLVFCLLPTACNSTQTRDVLGPNPCQSMPLSSYRYLRPYRSIPGEDLDPVSQEDIDVISRDLELSIDIFGSGGLGSFPEAGRVHHEKERDLLRVLRSLAASNRRALPCFDRKDAKEDLSRPAATSCGRNEHARAWQPAFRHAAQGGVLWKVPVGRTKRIEVRTEARDWIETPDARDNPWQTREEDACTWTYLRKGT